MTENRTDIPAQPLAEYVAKFCLRLAEGKNEVAWQMCEGPVEFSCDTDGVCRGVVVEKAELQQLQLFHRKMDTHTLCPKLISRLRYY